MQLSRDQLGRIAAQLGTEDPNASLMELPEKVLQFGTGVLLRGLPDYFIDKANKQGIFNGRIVIVKTTDSDSDAFERQDGLYTICVRGLENETMVEENIINASISRVLWAKTDWSRILECAHNPQLGIIISNTTEVGITLVDDDIHSKPPVSFPGKLLAFLYERYKAFNGSAASGMTIVPTELITENGARLESYVLELAHLNNLDFRFIEWLENNNTFCNSLVDRIVPGKPKNEELVKLQASLGYEDELLIITEAFRLWAIEGDDKVRKELSFSAADDGVVITPDITMYKELKLRLLNGTHTLNACLAFLYGFDLTKQSVNDKTYMGFMKKLVYGEISNAIPYDIDLAVRNDFAARVLYRFANPFIDHEWLSITLQQTAKMKMRVVPLLQKHYERYAVPPNCMAICFAAYLWFMKSEKKSNGKYFGVRNGKEYEIRDDEAGYFYTAWKNNTVLELATVVLRNENLWGADLTQLPLFLLTVVDRLAEISTAGVVEMVNRLENTKITV